VTGPDPISDFLQSILADGPSDALLVRRVKLAGKAFDCQVYWFKKLSDIADELGIDRRRASEIANQIRTNCSMKPRENGQFESLNPDKSDSF
jgi:hypothetical protein